MPETSCSGRGSCTARARQRVRRHARPARTSVDPSECGGTSVATLVDVSRIATQTFVDHVRAGGIGDYGSARKMIGATLAVIGSRLTDDEAGKLASKLSPELARVVEQEDYDSEFDAAELYERVRRRTGAPPGLAREQTDVVLRALGELLDTTELGRLARVLPEPIVRGLCGREESVVPPYRAAAPPPRRNLAEGRPGSTHPIAEAAPPSGHLHSVAANAEPHAETKLSSSHGLTQERLDETLATGRTPKTPR